MSLTSEQRATLEKIISKQSQGTPIYLATTDAGNFSNTPIPGSQPPQEIQDRLYSLFDQLESQIVKEAKETIDAPNMEFNDKSKQMKHLINDVYSGLRKAMKEKMSNQNEVDKVSRIAEAAVYQCTRGTISTEKLVGYFNETYQNERLYNPTEHVNEVTLSNEKLNKTKNAHIDFLNNSYRQIMLSTDNDPGIKQHLELQIKSSNNEMDRITQSNDSPKLKEIQIEKLVKNEKALFEMYEAVFKFKNQFEPNMPSSFDIEKFKRHGSDNDRPLRAILMWVENQTRLGILDSNKNPIILAEYIKGMEDSVMKVANRTAELKSTKMLEISKLGKEIEKKSSNRKPLLEYLGFKHKPSPQEKQQVLIKEVEALDTTLSTCFNLMKSASTALKSSNNSDVKPKSPEYGTLMDNAKQLHIDRSVSTLVAQPDKTLEEPQVRRSRAGGGGH